MNINKQTIETVSTPHIHKTRPNVSLKPSTIFEFDTEDLEAKSQLQIVKKTGKDFTRINDSEKYRA